MQESQAQGLFIARTIVCFFDKQDALSVKSLLQG